MRKKLWVLALSLLLVLSCAFAFTACGGDDGGSTEQEHNCFENAVKECDENYHYYVCSVCGKLYGGKEKHTFYENDGLTCNVCGYERNYSISYSDNESASITMSSKISGDVVVPNTVVGINEVGSANVTKVYFKCEEGGYPDITSLTLPESVTGIKFQGENNVDSDADLFPKLTTININGTGNAFDLTLFKHLKTVFAPKCAITCRAEGATVTACGGRIEVGSGTLNLGNSSDGEFHVYDSSAKILNLDSTINYFNNSNGVTGIEVLNAPALTSIGGYEGFTTLKELNAPLLEVIGAGTFMDNFILTTLNAPKIKYIGEHAFLNSTITELTIDNDSDVEIWSNYDYFTNLTVKAKSLTVKGVINVAEKLSLDLDELKMEYFYQNNSWGFRFKDGAVVNYNVANTVFGNDCYPLDYDFLDYDTKYSLIIGEKTQVLSPLTREDVVIKDVTFAENGVLSTIKPYSLAGLLMEEITLPDSVTTVGENAFNLSKTLKIVRHSDSLELPYTAVANCENYTYETEGGIKYFEKTIAICVVGDALENYVVREGTTHIYKECFHGAWSKVKTVSLPSSLKSIGQNAFDSCYYLTTVEMREGVTVIENEAFSGCSSLATISLPQTLITLGQRVFNGCENMTELTIPSSVKEMGEFYGFSSLEKINVPAGVGKIAENLFGKCTSLKDVTIEDGITEICENAFFNCKNLVSITIPASVTTVSDDAFKGCEKLADIDVKGDLILSENVTDSAVYKGQVFDGLYYRGTKVTGIADSTKKFIYVKDGTTSMSEDAFKNVTSFDAIYIPKTLKLVTNAFSGCNANAKYLFQGMFQGGTGITVSQALYNVDVDKNGFVYSEGTSDVTLIGYFGEATVVTIPSTYNDKPVTIIGEYAFSGNSAITSVTIGENVIDIYGGAFMNCSNLETVVISENLRMMNNLVFSGCGKLTNVTIHGDAFYIIPKDYEAGTGEAPAVIATVSVSDADLITKLKSTYSDYIWIRNFGSDN